MIKDQTKNQQTKSQNTHFDSESNLYLRKKKIHRSEVDDRIKIKQDNIIIIPCFSIKSPHAQINTQTIYPLKNKEGKDKFFEKGKPAKNIYFDLISINDTKNRLYVCEGWATGVAIRRIVNYPVYVSFSKDNLSSVAMAFKNDFKEVIICADNDDPIPYKTKAVGDNIVVIRPAQKGDFDDFQNNQFERQKLIEITPIYCPPIEIPKNIKSLVADLDKFEEKPIEYLDTNKIFLKNCLNVLTGDKGSMKSLATITYLLRQGVKFGYFSDKEVTEGDFKTLAIEEGKLNNTKWLNLEKLDSTKKLKEDLPDLIKYYNLDAVFEDPPFETSEFYSIEGIRGVLGTRQDIGNKKNSAILTTRNFNKDENKSTLGRVHSFVQWTTIPRNVVGYFKAEHNSAVFKQYEEDYGEGIVLQVVLIQPMIRNIGPIPEESLICILRTHPNGELKKPGKLFCEFRNTIRVSNVEKWGKGKTKAEIEKHETQEHIVLQLLKSKKDGLSSGDFKTEIIDKCSVRLRRASDIISKLKKDKLINGGGQKEKKPFKITKKGIDKIS